MGSRSSSARAPRSNRPQVLVRTGAYSPEFEAGIESASAAYPFSSHKLTQKSSGMKFCWVNGGRV